MAGATISYTVDSADVIAKLERCRNLGISLKQPLRQAGIYAMRKTDEHFQKEMGPQGSWEELADSTERQRRKGKKRAGNKILQDTGRLKMSVVRGGAGHVERLSDFSFEFGTNLVYAAIHQFGGVIKRAAGNITLRHKTTKSGKLAKQKVNQNLLVFAKKRNKYFLERTFNRKAYSITIKARPYLYLTKEDADNINDIFIQWADQKLRGA